MAPLGAWQVRLSSLHLCLNVTGMQKRDMVGLCYRTTWQARAKVIVKGSAVNASPLGTETIDAGTEFPKGATESRDGLEFGAWRDGMNLIVIPHRFYLHIRAADESLETRRIQA